MTDTSSNPTPTAASFAQGFLTWGMFWFVLATLAAGIFFYSGIETLLINWQLPEYSHGPLIPVLSGLLFLRQLKEYPEQPGPKSDRWPGVVLLVVALLLGGLGILSSIPDFNAYALILWVGAILLVSFGWTPGKDFWPPVVHLVYMLPLPGVIYFKISGYLQYISSELGVWFLQLANVPVFLDGNIIDLGVLKLHVAEACSGLRYMFPIMSFSYIFAVLYRGPMWHKAVLLISAVPIAIFMNSIRIAIAGILAQHYGVDWLEGFTHFFEGWVIFISCIAILFFLAWIMVLLRPDADSLSETLDLDTSGLGTQAMRLRHIMPSKAMIATAIVTICAAFFVLILPERGGVAPARDSFALFPRQLGAWEQYGPHRQLTPAVEENLAADDYHQVTLVSDTSDETVGLFMAWYFDQSRGGVHSPEICLPGAGWEIAWLERSDMTARTGSDVPFHLNRAIIQKGETRMMVFYWFQQKDRRIAWDMAAKYWLMVDGLRTGRTDGALVRLTTVIDRAETDAEAEARLMSVLDALEEPLPRFIPSR